MCTTFEYSPRYHSRSFVSSSSSDESGSGLRRAAGTFACPHGSLSRIRALCILASYSRASLATSACPSAAASPTVAIPTPCCSSSAVLALALSRTARSESLHECKSRH